MGVQRKFGQDGKPGASIHILSPTPSGAGVSLRVVNMPEIVRSFGWRTARDTVDHIRRMIELQFQCTDFDELESGQLSFFVDAEELETLALSPSVIETGLSMAVQAMLLSSFLSRDDVGPVPVIEVMVAVAGESAPLMSTVDGIVALSRQKLRRLSSDREIEDEAAARAHYRDLTARAAKFLSALLDEGGVEQYTPIARCGGDGCMYHSLSLAAYDASGVKKSLVDGYDAVCAMGLARAVDEMRVTRALEWVEADPLLSLGVQISQDSAVLDHWWQSILEKLTSGSKLAGRLYLELKPPFDVFTRPAVSEFCRTMRDLGVVIVLDRFGAGGSALRDIMVLQPDYIKIEESFLWRARDGLEAYQTLRHMIGLAHSLKAPAIVCGVDSEALAKVAHDAGAVWQCGDYFIKAKSTTG